MTPTAVTIAHAIRARRSVKRLLDTPVDPAAIERMIEAATWAPNHHLTEPWRFWVISGDARERFGEAMAAADLAKHADADAVRRETMRVAAVGKAFRAPVIVAIAAVMPEDGKNPELEEITAVAAATQNLLLQAEAEGLGTIWRTGRSAYEPEVAAFFGLTERDRIIAFVYVGHPDPDAPARTSTRRPVAEVTTWLEV